MTTTSQDLQLLKKQRVAAAALTHLRDGMILGVGTGSTVNAFIDQLGPWVGRLAGAVSSSDASTRRLEALGIPIVDLNEVDGLGLYIDGADEANDHLELIKGGGAALAGKRPAFEDGRLEELFFRYRARNWPDTLDMPTSSAN